MGVEVQPRDQSTLELDRPYMSVVNARYPVLRDPGRKLGYRFMAAEAAWILGGQDDVASIAPYSRDIANFSDNGKTFYGAYGPRVAKGWDECLYRLIRDHSTRQAVIDIWRSPPPEGTKDTPCTLSWQFVLRGQHLHLNVSMRSSDVWLGWPYDVFTQSMAILAMCLELKAAGVTAEPGEVRLTAGSQHIYERNMAQAFLALRHEPESVAPLRTDRATMDYDFTSKAELVEHLWAVASFDTSARDLKHDFLLGLKMQLDNKQRGKEDGG